MTLIAEHQKFTWKQYLAQVAFVGLAVLVGFAIHHVSQSSKIDTLERHPEGIMGTSCTLAVSVSWKDRNVAEQKLDAAEKILRECELLTSTWLETSEISRFNSAPAGEPIPLSPFTMECFRKAQKAYQETDGAFDITCGPVWELWKKGAEENQLPTETALAQARNASCWANITLGENFAVKKNAATRVVTGGIAKGMAIDKALATLMGPEIVSAMVEVGGDMALWKNQRPVEIRNPKEESATTECVLSDGGLCTSGDYARFFEIDGQKYSQIIDPRTSRPVTFFTSVTVSAPDATTADIWATALCVLGPEGEKRLPDGTQAQQLLQH
ncbi:MAG: FAD:protein FMN transferase [Planctomycetia bacterium]|nr:FAD:protein FMN transferase [Planctomycetia bacterium]